jgi:pimeloyl-ACP methyl ester carboxylesterase
MSLGGYLAARAAAFEHRFRAAVFFDGVYDLNEADRRLLPKEAVAALDAGDTVKCEEIIHKGMQNNTGLRWSIAQSLWSFGASNIADFLKKIERYTMVGIAGQIQCPCLVMEAEGDMFLPGQPQQIFDALKVPKQLVKFTSEDGAENHCQSGALAYKDEVVFNWLDETLDLRDGRRG